MKPQLVKLLIFEVGLEEETAEHAVDTFIDFIRHNPIQIASYLVRHDESSTRARQGELFG